MEPTVNAGMSVSDWSGLVAMAVSICALISPILTAICNNWHQRKMKQMEYDHQEREDHLKREREIYEGYIRAAGAAVQSETLDNLSEFGSHSALAMYYAPKELREDMLSLERLVKRTSATQDLHSMKVELLNKIVVRLRDTKETQSSANQ